MYTLHSTTLRSWVHPNTSGPGTVVVPGPSFYSSPGLPHTRYHLSCKVNTHNKEVYHLTMQYKNLSYMHGRKEVAGWR